MRLPAASRLGLATVRRALALALVAFALAGVIAVVAVYDHRRVGAQNWSANQASWYCQHNGTRCDELQIADLERRWEHRELGYRMGFLSFSAAGTAAVIVALALAWEARRPARSRSAQSSGSS
jgi:hypothetical protein